LPTCCWLFHENCNSSTLMPQHISVLLLESKVSLLMDRWRWTSCLASTLTWFRFTEFLLVRLFKIVGVIITSMWCGNCPIRLWQVVRQCTTCQEFGIVFGWQWDVMLRPVLRRGWTCGTFTVRYCEEQSVIDLGNYAFLDLCWYKLFLLSTYEELIPAVLPCIF
jgi:hypothetical protein